jgi:hypothetical protein
MDSWLAGGKGLRPVLSQVNSVLVYTCQLHVTAKQHVQALPNVPGQKAASG